jgi:hypothetical protein
MMIEQGVTDLHFDNGIVVSALDSDRYAGNSLNYIYAVSIDGYTDKFLLKYDDAVSSYVDVIVPRIMKQAGGYTPSVVPLATEVYTDVTPFGEGTDEEFRDRTRYPFLQTWAGQDEGLTPIGEASDDQNRDYLIKAIADASASVESQKKLALEFLRFTFSNIVAFRDDTHAGNVFIVEDDKGDISLVGIDNGYALSQAQDTPETNSIVEDSIKYATFQVGLAWYVKQFLKENPDSEKELKDTITEWADNLRKWLESDGREPLGEYGVWGTDVKTPYQVSIENFLNQLINTDIDTIWELMLKYSPDKVEQGKTIADWAPKFVRDIFKG